MKFNQKITDWYQVSKRDLPWRNTRNPYYIWISEIILQQTRVSQGLDYYYRFTETFPEVETLAKATENQVLAVWKGLGYYSRARNMHHTARMVVEKYNGIFPSSYNELIKLKGIGEYTAAAISSICAGEPIPVVDGNVVRIFSRIFGFNAPVGSTRIFKDVKQKSTEFISDQDPGTYNQAVMEFGALFCKPQTPECSICIFKKDCFAFNHNKVDSLPVSKPEIKKRSRWFNYLVIQTPDGLLMKKRDAGDIWTGLWEFPLFEAGKLMDDKEIIRMASNEKLLTPDANITIFKKDYRHILTHQIIHARFFIVDVETRTIKTASPELKIFSREQYQKTGVSRLMEKFITDADLF
ncbi:MAG: A/G-specific adenine glycosylase [Lentimicrobium sp.]|nr:A/G-specific adenine glycosylase [Lentimicrobium sp.]